jgi:signal transduction histidine kinase
MGGGVRRGDVVLPLGIALVATIEALGYDGQGRLAALAVELVACVPLVFRRRFPLVASTATGVVAMGPWFVGGPAINDLATPILIFISVAYALGRWIADLRGLIGMAVILAGTVFAYATVDERPHNVTDVVFVLALSVPPYVMGRVTRRLSEFNALLRREQELVRQAALRDERERIARELHDVIAHSVSAMVVQVAAAQDLVRTDPELAEQVLDRVAETGRRAIAETGRLLHVIRDADNELGLPPTRGLSDLGAVVGEFRRDGLDIDLVEGVPADLPAAVDMSAYRIVREALTNALRYSPTREVRVEVLGTPSGLTIRAVNPSDGRTGLGSGLGIAGLTERVELLGGTLKHGPTNEGTYELVVQLPLETREPV